MVENVINMIEFTMCPKPETKMEIIGDEFVKVFDNKSHTPEHKIIKMLRQELGLEE
jgi:GMP synthase PP-ATPase subunit